MSRNTGIRYQFQLLGPLEVVRDGQTLSLSGRRQRGLLALLLLSANRVVSRERLIDGLWGGAPPPTAANALQVAVHGLRRTIGVERVETRGTGYAIRVESDELDLGRFKELVARARREQPAAAAASLGDALALWRGAPLADLTEAPFADQVARELMELRLAALEEWIEAQLAIGCHAEVVGELEALIAEQPYRERLRHQLMLALYRCGRQADALAAFQQARDALVDQLGLEPGAELKQLEQSILRQDDSLAPPPARLPPQTRLPAPATSLVGRELELAAITSLLRRADVRLLTLTGPGGTGKTRLAVEAARELSAEFPDGVVFVDLSALDDPELVSGTVARAIGIGDSGQAAADALEEALRMTTVLLVLDNFERVDEAAPLVSGLLSAAAGLKALVTSRGVLRLSGEHVYQVPPLRTPGREEASDTEALARNEAVALFVARARAAQYEFELSSANAPAIAEICVALDGLPLALELAAAQVRVLSAPALLTRLERRLDVLTGGPRDRPARHQTLRATIDWSFDLLAADERELFAGLAVFAAGCTLEAATEVCGADLETVEALIDKGLVRAQNQDGGVPRFWMLETVREYALERLADRADAEELRQRHATYFARLAEAADAELRAPVQGPERAERLDRLEADHDNFRAALAWTDENDPNTHLQVATRLVELWADRSYFEEGLSWLERGLAHAGPLPPALHARALHGACYLAFGLGDYERSELHGEASLALYRELGDKEGAGRTVHILGWVASERGDLERAARLGEESLALARELGHTRGVIVSLSNLGTTAARRGDHDRSKALLDEGLALARAHGDRTGIAFVLMHGGELALEQGQHDQAGRMLAESLVLYRDHGSMYSVAGCMARLALLAETRGDPVAAARLLGFSERLRESIGTSPARSETLQYATVVDRLRATLGNTDFSAEWANGRALPIDQAISTALAVAST